MMKTDIQKLYQWEIFHSMRFKKYVLFTQTFQTSINNQVYITYLQKKESKCQDPCIINVITETPNGRTSLEEQSLPIILNPLYKSPFLKNGGIPLLDRYLFSIHTKHDKVFYEIIVKFHHHHSDINLSLDFILSYQKSINEEIKDYWHLSNVYLPFQNENVSLIDEIVQKDIIPKMYIQPIENLFPTHLLPAMQSHYDFHSMLILNQNIIFT